MSHSLSVISSASYRLGLAWLGFARMEQKLEVTGLTELVNITQREMKIKLRFRGARKDLPIFTRSKSEYIFLFAGSVCFSGTVV